MADTPSCLFCRIIGGEIPATIVHRDDMVIAFRDINPAAPTHILVVPTEHLPNVGAVDPSHDATMGAMIRTANTLAQREGVESSGYRLVINCGPDAGQSVDHLHLHLIGGRSMAWPPG